MEDRLAFVRRIPPDTISYYCSLLEKIPNKLVASSKRAFAWVIGARRALTVRELQHAIILDPAQKTVGSTSQSKTTCV